MLSEIIRPLQKQVELLDIDFGELKVEKIPEKTGKTARYFILLKLACKNINDGIKLLKEADKELKRSLQ